MKRLVCLLADPADPFTRTLEVELASADRSVRVLKVGERIPPCALLISDLDYADAEGGEERIAFHRGPGDGKRILHRPFLMEELRRLIRETLDPPALLPSEDFRTVTVGEETVLLSECEAKILSALHGARGRVVLRRELALSVFPTAADPEDSLRVYIHYLRKKLERNGKRLILSHRGGGYSLLTN